jgi:DNA-binding NtrC family response regulator
MRVDRDISRRCRMAHPLPCSRRMSILYEPDASLPCPADYHGAVSQFKRRLIEMTLRESQGNRTHAARVLGLQRTYLLRLIRDLNVAVPPPAERRRRA